MGQARAKLAGKLSEKMRGPLILSFKVAEGAYSCTKSSGETTQLK